MKVLKNIINKSLTSVIKYINESENLIKNIEYSRGIYRYPKSMLGRVLPKNYNYTDVLVFAAHQDDDVLGLCTTLYRHSIKRDNIKVIFVTNGTGWNGGSWRSKVSTSKWKFKTRYREAVQALSLINIPEENIFCLGYPDGGTQRYLKSMFQDIFMIIRKMNPSQIYVHCIEGGHRDHDLTSFVVKSVCKKIGYSNVYEWTEYTPSQPLGTQDVKFLSSKSNEIKQTKINISQEERLLKRRMLAHHQSQDVEKFFLQGEAVRRANISKAEDDLFEYAQFPEKKLKPLVDSFNKTLTKLKVYNLLVCLLSYQYIFDIDII